MPAFEYRPTAHAAHAAAPDAAHDPGAQDLQALAATAPVALLAVDAAQGTHAKGDTAPIAGEYVPLPQSVHDDAPGVDAYVPALQEVHTAAEVAPRAALDVPRPHGVQLLAPLESA
jgi:hypothetical protein